MMHRNIKLKLRISYLADSRLREHFLCVIVWGLKPERVLLYWQLAFDIAAVTNLDWEVTYNRTVQCCIV